MDRQVVDQLETHQLLRHAVFEDLEILLRKTLHRFVAVDHQREELDEIDIDVFEVLRRVDENQVFRRGAVGPIGHRPHVGGGAVVRQEDRQRPGGLVEGRQQGFVEVKLDPLHHVSLRHHDLRLRAQAFLVFLAGPRLGEAHREAVIAGVDQPLVGGEGRAGGVESFDAQDAGARCFAEVELDVPRRVLFDQDRHIVEGEDHFGDVFAGGQRFDAHHAGLPAAEQRRDLDGGFPIRDGGIGFGQDAFGFAVINHRRHLDRGHLEWLLGAVYLAAGQIFDFVDELVAARPQRAFEEQRQLFRGLAGREVEFVAEAVEKLPVAQDLAGQQQVVRARLAQHRGRQLIARHQHVALDHGAALVAARETHLERGVEGHGIGRQIGRIGREGGRPLLLGNLRRFDDTAQDRHHPELAALRLVKGERRQEGPALLPAMALDEIAGQAGLVGGELIDAVEGLPQAVIADSPLFVEKQQELEPHGIALLVVPDFRRHQPGRAAHLDAFGGPAVGQKHPGAIVVQATEGFARLAHAAFVVFAVFVAAGIRVGIARFPETFDEGVTLVVLLDGQEELLLLLGDDRLHIVQPLPVFGRQRGEQRLFALFLFGLVGLGLLGGQEEKGHQGHQGHQGLGDEMFPGLGLHGFMVTVWGLGFSWF